MGVGLALADLGEVDGDEVVGGPGCGRVRPCGLSRDRGVFCPAPARRGVRKDAGLR